VNMCSTIEIKRWNFSHSKLIINSHKIFESHYFRKLTFINYISLLCEKISLSQLMQAWIRHILKGTVYQDFEFLFYKNCELNNQSFKNLTFPTMDILRSYIIKNHSWILLITYLTLPYHGILER
jgi:uncharacterized protein with von Willebrand factor type A (vWA) domain